MDTLISRIKQKKELQSIDDKFVKKEIDNYFNRNPNAKKYLLKVKSTKYKQIVKEIRAKLRRVYGLFRDDKRGRKKLLENKLTKENIIKILKTHSSTKERLPYYHNLYKKIFAITGKPKSILDLGCGINPYSLIFMENNPKYLAYDLDKDEISNLNKFLKNGTAEIKDITQIKTTPKVDLAFLFKITDVIEIKGHKVTERLLKLIKAKYLVVSFPTITISGKPMNFPRRKWIELLCQRLGYTYKVVTIPNEIFYVIRK